MKYADDIRKILSMLNIDADVLLYISVCAACVADPIVEDEKPGLVRLQHILL